MPAIKGQFSLFRGADERVEFTMRPATSISGWTLRFVASSALGTASAALSVAGTISDASDGEFYFDLPAASTAALAAGRYFWEARRTDSGSYTVLAHGTFELIDRPATWPNG